METSNPISDIHSHWKLLQSHHYVFQHYQLILPLLATQLQHNWFHSCHKALKHLQLLPEEMLSLILDHLNRLWLNHRVPLRDLSLSTSLWGLFYAVHIEILHGGNGGVNLFLLLLLLTFFGLFRLLSNLDLIKKA